MENVVKEMMFDRGYNGIEEINDTCWLAKTQEHSQSEWAQEHSQRELAQDKITLIYFCKEDKSGVKSYKNVVKFINENECKSVIFIYKSCITIFARNEFEKLSKDSIAIEIFSEAQLQYNITKHYLVPKHELLSEKNKLEIIGRLRCDLKSLPVITFNDPISRYYNYKRGQLIKITRKSPTNGVYVLYRVVY
jgi:DNA-directed RNA polymerase I, II, and III subunit RPABC1